LVTIIAHVDHGKTTLADNLIEANGIISERLAGTLRYLDSMEEEQRRGITMRTSAIGLRHSFKGEEKVIHLLDSPGHTDFAPEVSSALQCSDGALLVVDVVEGMCARTHQVLREAHAHQLIPVLVINKMDRLCNDLGLSTSEAYMRVRTLLEQVNAATAAMLVSHHSENHDTNTESEEDAWTFEPWKGNVVFCSAFYGWGFTVPSLARTLFRSKLIPIKPMVLKQYLFGDFKYKDGKVLKWKQNDEALPLFSEFALQPLWDIYEHVASSAGGNLAAFARKSQNELAGMQEVLTIMQTGGTGSQIPTTLVEMQDIMFRTCSSSEEAVLRSLLRRYRPLSVTILDAVCENCPSPNMASKKVRTRALALASPPSPSEAFLNVQSAVATCDPSGLAVAHVCKFLSTDRSNIRDPDLPPSDDKNVILGLARVLSGTIHTGQPYHWMGPKHQYGMNQDVKTVRLYLLMGSSFVRVDHVPAGHICAVYGLEELQLKTVTLCESPDGMPLQGLNTGIRPLVKVNVEPVSASDTDALERGLVKLSLADAAVEVTATAKGERILACLGEIHLEQSILDLEKVYCGKELKLRISDPIVEFGETTDWFQGETADYAAFYDDRSSPLARQAMIPPYCEEEGIGNAYRGRTRTILSGRSAAIRLRVVPLSESIYSCLKLETVTNGSEEDLVQMCHALGCPTSTPEKVLQALLDTLCALDDSGNAIVESKGITNGTCVRGVVDREVHVPLKKSREEENGTPTMGLKEYEYIRKAVRNGGLMGLEPPGETPSEAHVLALQRWKTKMSGSAVAGFQMAMRSGPLCEEPVRGILVVLESVEICSSNETTSGGMVVAALRSGIRCALLTRPARLMEGHLKLTLHSSLAGLGPLYAVLSKKRGKVLEDTMVDGTDLIMITATLPQAESFRLAPELLQKSSGEVTAPELTFSQWARLDEDPFWIPTSLEEREDFGEIVMNGDVSTGLDNTALKYIRQVRERKGLLVDSSRTVIAAEKQRTLKR
jgi:ribosome assembly protein 1